MSINVSESVKKLWQNKEYREMQINSHKEFYKKATPEQKLKIISNLVNNSGEKHFAWKGGLPKCIVCGKQLARYKSKRCRAHQFTKEVIQKMSISQKKWLENPDNFKFLSIGGITSSTRQQRLKEPTSIEKKLYDELKRRGILFETQKLINGKFLVDAYIPSLNLIIEADGNYWHSLDRVVKKDKAENAYLKKCGYNLIRMSETEINNNSFKGRLNWE